MVEQRIIIPNMTAKIHSKIEEDKIVFKSNEKVQILY